MHSSLFIAASFAVLALILAGPMEGAIREHHDPPFLKNVTVDGRHGFEKIFENQNQTKAQVTAALNSWATTYGVQDAVTAYTTEMNALKTEERANVTAAANGLSNALTQVYAVCDNENLTGLEMASQMKTLIESFSNDLRRLVGAAIGGGNMGVQGGFSMGRMHH